MLYLGAVIICDALRGCFVVVLNGSEALHILLFCSRRLSFIHLCLPAFIEEAPALKVENDHALTGSKKKMTLLCYFFYKRIVQSDATSRQAGLMLC